MSKSSSVDKILVAGREVGPITKIIKNFMPKASIGAVDVLGNEDTRMSSSWNFSVIKQSPGMPIQPPKHHSLIELLYQLTLIMMEDIDFDILILLPPFHTKPSYVEKLSQKINVTPVDLYSLKKTFSAFSFIKLIEKNFPEVFPTSTYLSNIEDNTEMEFPALFITDAKNNLLVSKRDKFSFIQSEKSGFVFPFSKIHCAFFICSSVSINFLGLQTLYSPYQHSFFKTDLEKNAFLPYSPSSYLSRKTIISFLLNLITHLKLLGLITLYFILMDEKILPISCTVLPDENFGLWENRSKETLLSYLISPNLEYKSKIFISKIAFKLPIYSSQPLIVPIIPEKIARERNLANVTSHPDYPLCVIYGFETSISNLTYQIQQKTDEIKQIFNWG